MTYSLEQIRVWIEKRSNSRKGRDIPHQAATAVKTAKVPLPSELTWSESMVFQAMLSRLENIQELAEENQLLLLHLAEQSAQPIEAEAPEG